jgi:hypothetical protein
MSNVLDTNGPYARLGGVQDASESIEAPRNGRRGVGRFRNTSRPMTMDRAKRQRVASRPWGFRLFSAYVVDDELDLAREEGRPSDIS